MTTRGICPEKTRYFPLTAIQDRTYAVENGRCKIPSRPELVKGRERVRVGFRIRASWAADTFHSQLCKSYQG